uniref:Uncharacterized protein n=1 Tax=Alexandrium andersonii TaxID=327968 RepID=A0A7S2C336_9DINO|mmetsp:Transcript_32905/g.74919  ORF Transcript_32905/g.74919 Transcript_32905/m.74919 type:complete len:139 (+) Transcript_32905:1-417(+)
MTSMTAEECRGRLVTAMSSTAYICPSGVVGSPKLHTPSVCPETSRTDEWVEVRACIRTSFTKSGKPMVGTRVVPSYLVRAKESFKREVESAVRALDGDPERTPMLPETQEVRVTHASRSTRPTMHRLQGLLRERTFSI